MFGFSQTSRDGTAVMGWDVTLRMLKAYEEKKICQRSRNSFWVEPSDANSFVLGVDAPRNVWPSVRPNEAIT
eukprot:6981724-Ditylum_brightwellii.AAC.1